MVTTTLRDPHTSDQDDSPIRGTPSQDPRDHGLRSVVDGVAHVQMSWSRGSCTRRQPRVAEGLGVGDGGGSGAASPRGSRSTVGAGMATLGGAAAGVPMSVSVPNLLRAAVSVPTVS